MDDKTWCLLLLMGLVGPAAAYFTGWDAPASLPPGSDLMIYGATLPACYGQYSKPTYDCRWPANLNRRVDEIILNGTIIAYKIRWFNGQWSVWFVPGMNDIGRKFNPWPWPSCPVPYKAKSLRRRWASFYDHVHYYIICKYD